MPLRRARLIVYLIPVTPRTAPMTHVQITFESADIAMAMIPAMSHAIVPRAIRSTTDLTF